MKSETLLKLIAIYLPQYHPIPENDRWWGKGFTEWTNVTRATPKFKHHYQPHLPADLGFYDLRLPEAREAQAELAKEYGIYGFCYYHYWFNGKRLLNRPFDDILASGKPDFPFCLCWANETWSRRWLGEEQDILIKQDYSQDDDIKHIQWLIPAFSDPRCITIQGKPLFIIYRPLDLPNLKQTIEIFRQECLRAGLPQPYLLGANSHSMNSDFTTYGFDGTLDFKPQLGSLPYAFQDINPLTRLSMNLKNGIISNNMRVYNDGQARNAMKKNRDFITHQCVFVGFDNTPRRGNKSIVIHNSSPQNFEIDLKEAIAYTQKSLPEGTPIFINAWNEWAEGNHLEPDQKFGTSYLEMIRNTIINNQEPS